MEKLVFRKVKEWGPAKEALWVPEDIAGSVKALAEEANISTKTITCELLAFAMKYIEIVE